MSAPMEPWQWDEETWRGYVGAVTPGQRLLPDAWPGGASAAVAISFDADHETPSLRDSQTSPGSMAQGGYGARAGVPRLLKLLERHGVHASFYIPAVSALTYPDQVRAYADAGHEVGTHGWIHERNTLLPAEAERELAQRALDVLERLAGRRPVGMRTPSWDFSPNTLSIAAELGLSYDSSLMADDDPYELVANGTPTGIVEIPVDWIRDDAPYFMMERFSGLRPYTPPRSVLGIWLDELRGAIAEGGVFQLTMHPHIIGHRSRIWILDELLGEVARQNVWVATHAEIASYVREAGRR